MYFRNYGLPKTWLDQCLKCPTVEEHLKGNIVNMSKHCGNFNNSTIIIFIDHCEGN